MTAIATTDLACELENVIKAGSPERRVQILRQVAGPFLSDAGRLREHHTGAFDEFLVRLMPRVYPRVPAERTIRFGSANDLKAKPNLPNGVQPGAA